MTPIARNDMSVLGQWWWTVDRWSIAALSLLILFGALMVFAASPPVAERIGLDGFHFARRHMTLLPVGMLLLFGVSLLSPRGIRRLAGIGFLCCVTLLVLTLLIGTEIKGARRWLAIGGFSLQASEFLKPCFVIIAGWLFAEWRKEDGLPGQYICIGLYLMLIALLIAQPDLGMVVLLSAVWFGQFFLAGLPMLIVLGMIGLGIGGLVGAYVGLAHVRDRVDRFLDPTAGDNYQVGRSIEAFANGGLLGTGPGEGTVKLHLPDAHADFVFSVAGEEFGAIAALALIALYGFIVLRGFVRVFAKRDLFVALAAAGLLTQFGLQALVHMGSSLQLIPAKGMTLPFISYGGSSFLALSLAMGMLLALTRRRPGEDQP